MGRVRSGGHLGLIGVAASLIIAGIACCGVASRSGGAGPPPQPSASASAMDAPISDEPSSAAQVLPASEPTRIEIPAIGVRAPVFALGLEPDGTIAVPPLSRVHETSWYKYGPTPGELGPAVIVGHVDSKAGPGVFYKLGALKPGARVQVTRKDGKTPTFRVERLERVAKDKFPTDRVYGPVDHSALRLITCGGSYNPAAGHYTDNIIVYASLVS